MPVIPHLLAALCCLTATHAATIHWTSKTYTLGGEMGEILKPGQFATDGVLFMADNCGGPVTVFDGIDFKMGTIGFSGGSFDEYHQSGELLSQFATWGKDGEASTVQLDGLVVGRAYRIQTLLLDGRADRPVFIGRMAHFDEQNMGVYSSGVDEVTWGQGLLVTGIFTADSVSQSFTIETFKGENSHGGHLNALLVHDISDVPSLAGASGVNSNDVPTTSVVPLGAGCSLILRRRQ